MFSTLFGHLVNGLECILHVRSVVKVMDWFDITILFRSRDAATVHLAVLGSGCAMQLDEDLHIVLLSPCKDLINVRRVLIWRHHLHVPESLLLSLHRSVGCDLPAEVDPVPVTSRNSDHLDAP